MHARRTRKVRRTTFATEVAKGTGMFPGDADAPNARPAHDKEGAALWIRIVASSTAQYRRIGRPTAALGRARLGIDDAECAGGRARYRDPESRRSVRDLRPPRRARWRPLPQRASTLPWPGPSVVAVPQGRDPQRLQPKENQIGVGNVASLNRAWVGPPSGDPLIAGRGERRGLRGLRGREALRLDAMTGSRAGPPQQGGSIHLLPCGRERGRVRGLAGIASSTPSMPPGSPDARDAEGLHAAVDGPTAALVNSSPDRGQRRAHVGSVDGNLYAFDAAGITGCSGTPKGARRCGPPAVGSMPLLACRRERRRLREARATRGRLDGNLYAFDAAGITGCSGMPKVCSRSGLLQRSWVSDRRRR